MKQLMLYKLPVLNDNGIFRGFDIRRSKEFDQLQRLDMNDIGYLSIITVRTTVMKGSVVDIMAQW